MQSLQLSADRSKPDANFEGCKFSMDNKHFETQKLEQTICIHAPSSKMVTLQHMKVFTNDNQLFCDTKSSTDTLEHLYRILDTGHIQKMIYDKNTQKWDISIVANLEIAKNDGSAFPANLLFTENDLVIACDGFSEIQVFLTVNGSNWVNMLKHKVTEKPGLALIEARVLNQKLEILAYEVENDDEQKKTRSRIHWITVRLDDIDYAENLSIEKSTVFIQNGHFETCTFTNDGHILFLSSEKPRGHQDKVSEVSVLEQSWSQNENVIEARFKLSDPVSEEDITVDITKFGIKLLAKETSLLNGKLGGEFDEKNVEICAEQNTNTVYKDDIKLHKESIRKTIDAVWIHSDVLLQKNYTAGEFKKIADAFGRLMETSDSCLKALEEVAKADLGSVKVK